MQFSENLIRLRKEKGLSQEQLGNEIYVTRQTISKWELGDTVPDMNKLIELSRLFNISVDELVGNNECNRSSFDTNTNTYGYRIIREYEYKSKREIRGIPLVHINIGYGFKKAKGIIAIGNFAEGVIAIGGFSLGIISLGGLGAGLITLGGLSLGLLLAIGGVAIGSIAVGGFSLGLFAMGGCAIGIYAFGGAAIARDIAYGGYASGHIAIGDETRGAICFITENGHATFTPEEVKSAILKEFPNTWKVLVSLFSNIHQYSN
jgi:transcriptional regulator with XRE-family HTH domain